MPQNLDDFDLDPTERGDEPIRPPREPGGIGFPMILVGAAVLAIALLGALYYVFRQPAAPAAASAPVAAAPAAPVPATPAVPLPPLDTSDAFVREIAQALSSHPELARWLAQNALVRTLTAVVDNVANGETPRPHLEFLAPKQRFAAARRPAQQQSVPDPAGFAGYEPFADAVASLDAGATAAAYRTLAPLFEAAYVDLGHPAGGFPKALAIALQALVAVPVLREDVALVPHAVGFRYQDPALEALTPAQKQFLRIGPRNVRIVQGKLRELQAALAP